MTDKTKLNKPAFFVLIVCPVILAYLATQYCLNHGAGWFELWFAVTAYYVTNISVGVGLHRLWAHQSFKTSKAVEVILSITSAGALQGPALAWASDHFKHHTYTDKDLDPHSPRKFTNPIKGFLWSHIGWMLFKDYDHKIIDRVTLKKLGRNKILSWQLKYYWQLAIFMNVVVPFAMGLAIGGSFELAYGAFLFWGIGRAVQQHMTFCVNSVCHFWGQKKYTAGTAVDIWWLAPFLLGENWHNFHHAFPSDYRNGHRWYHLDVHKWIIYGLYKLGLAEELNATPEVRIQAKSQATKQELLEEKKHEWLTLEQMYCALKERIGKVMPELDSGKLCKQAHEQLQQISLSVESKLRQLNEYIQATELPSNQALRSMKNAFQKLQNSLDIVCHSYLAQN